MKDFAARASNRPIFVSATIAVALHALLLLGWSKVILEESAYGVGHQGVGGMTIVALAPAVGAAPQPVLAPPVPERPVIPPVQPKQQEFQRKVAKKKVVKEQAATPPPVSPAPTQSGSSEGTGGGSGGEINPAGGTVTGSGTAVSAQPDYLRNPPPTYPRESRLAKEEGTVLLQVAISAAGIVKELSLKRSSGFPKLDEAALKSVKGWKFKPAILAGIAIDSQVEVPIRFKLR